MTELVVDWCSYEAAKYAVMHWHYSKTMPKGANNYFGVWENSSFIGCIIYGFSISPSVGITYGLNQYQISELRRVAMTTHESFVSESISKSLGLLKLKNPKTRLLVSYADTLQEHHGGIYQASNWTYVGRSSKMTQYLIGGVWRNDTHAYNEKKHLATDSRKIPAKHKYLYPLDKAMRRQINKLAKPYPKKETCGQSVNGDTLATSQKAGSIPVVRSIDTGSLQGESGE